MQGKKKDHKYTHPVRRVIKWIVLCFLMFVAVVVVYLVIRLYPTYKEYVTTANTTLIDMTEENFMRLGNTYIYDKDDNLIGEIGNEKYEYVPLDKVSDDVIYGYVANEDKNFFSHNGIDIKALARATLALIRNNGEITQGGSTITQQVVKNNILSQEQTYERKILEILIAVRLERMYSKNDIMEFYVNSCYYGENCYGIEGAAQYYFGVSAKDLTLGESAMLVASSVSPSTHNPVADYDYMMDQKAVVLDEMVEEGYITEADAAAAKEERPVIVQKSENIAADNYMISYSIHSAAIELMKEDGFTFKYTYSSSDEYDSYEEEYNTAYNEAVNTVRAGGYNLYTSFDTDVQDTLQSAVDSGLSDFTERDEESGIYAMQGAAVCIDNESGLVIAAVGGREAEDSYNRAYQAKREAGSAIKPLLDYGPALSEGVIYPDTVYNDAQFDDDGYSPSNAGGAYYGNVTVREAVARSLNTVALQVFIDDGIDTSLSYLNEMEFSSLTYADSTMDSIALGALAEGATVSDMARGYYTLENEGEYTDASCLRRIETNAGETVYGVDDDAITKEVYIPDAAFMMTDMMQGAFREDYGTAHKAYNDNMICAGKTGTTNDSKDGWFCGYSAYYTCAVWVGYDEPRETDGLSGNSYPLTIWSSFMNDMHDGLEKKDFDVPDTVYLENSSGEVRAVDKNGDVYASRPEGFEYRSSILDAREAARARQRAEAVAEEEAEAALVEFEAIVIASYEDALNLDSYYNDVLDKINLVTDQDVKEGLLERAAKKYETLSNEVASAWSDADEMMAEAEAAQRDEDIAAAADASLTYAQNASSNATSQTENSRKNAVEWYITYLNRAQYHTSAVDQMISDARNALSKCTSYSWYNDVSNRLSSAISRAQNLPSEAETQQEAPIEEEIEEEPDIDNYEDDLNEYNGGADSSDILSEDNTG